MALDFPTSPANGQLFNGYVYDTSLPGWRNINTSQSQSVALQYTTGLTPLVPASVTVSSGSATVNSVGTVSFTSAGTMQLNGIFSSAYNYYHVKVQTIGKSSNSSMRFCTNGTPNSSAGYNWTMFVVRSSTTSTGYGGGGATSIYDFTYGADTNNNVISMDFFNPMTNTERTMIQYQQSGPGLESRFGAGEFGTASTTFDGFQIYPLNGAGTYTGKISVYGYR